LYKISFENETGFINSFSAEMGEVANMKVHDFPKDGKSLIFRPRQFAKIEIDLSDCEFDGKINTFEMTNPNFSFSLIDQKFADRNKWNIIYQPDNWDWDDTSSLKPDDFGMPIKFNITIKNTDDEELDSFKQSFKDEFLNEFKAPTCSFFIADFIQSFSGVEAQIQIPLSRKLFNQIKNSIIDDKPYLPSNLTAYPDENGELIYPKNRFTLVKGSHLSFTIFTHGLLNGLYSGPNNKLFLLLSKTNEVNVKDLISNYSEYSSNHEGVDKLVYNQGSNGTRLPFRLRYSLPDYDI